MEMKFITSNGGELWHLAKVKESRGERTGRVLSTYQVTACTGKQIGGVWGYSTRSLEKDGVPSANNMCKRCLSILDKQGVCILP